MRITGIDEWIVWWAREMGGRWAKAKEAGAADVADYFQALKGYDEAEVIAALEAHNKGRKGVWRPTIHDITDYIRDHPAYRGGPAAAPKAPVTSEDRVRGAIFARLCGGVAKDAVTRFHCQLEYLVRMYQGSSEQRAEDLAEQAYRSALAAGVEVAEAEAWVRRAVAYEKDIPTDRWIVPMLEQEIGPIPGGNK